MITVDFLEENGFFGNISKIKNLCSNLKIKNIYIAPPINSKDNLYLMVEKSNDCTIEDFLNFMSSVNSLLEKNLITYIFDIEDAKEAIQEDSISREEYQNALVKAIPIDNLLKDVSLEEQWEKQSAQHTGSMREQLLTAQHSILPKPTENIPQEARLDIPEKPFLISATTSFASSKLSSGNRKRKSDELRSFVSELTNDELEELQGIIKERKISMASQQSMVS